MCRAESTLLLIDSWAHVPDIETSDRGQLINSNRGTGTPVSSEAIRSMQQ